MPGARNREEAINTQLAILISSLGVTADAETIRVHGKHRPDVLFQLRGLRVVIEGKFSDVPNAQQIVLGDARKRVSSGLAHIATAAIYPPTLRTTPTAKILDVLKRATLKYCIIAETRESEWFEGTPAALMNALRRAQEALTEDDIVERTAKSLSMRLEGVAGLWMGQAGACDRLSEILGIPTPKGEKVDKAQDRRETAAKVSALVLANAFIFQDQLAASDGRITALAKLEREHNLVKATAEHWEWIWEAINYVPIFQLGERILAELPSSKNTTIAVKALLSEARQICSEQAALRHDLMGRIYHWLLHYAKYLGTYYTAVPSATLLLKLTLALPWKQDFGDPTQLAKFKVGDLACGTGTLLMAAAQAFSDVFIRLRAEKGRSLETKDLSTLHKALMENMLYGYDVLPSAVHLTASTLALLAPEVAFRRMNLYVMPLGMSQGQPRLGSLDFLTGSELSTQMALDYSQLETIRQGASHKVVTNATVPLFNLCVMNPPFVRSVGNNLLFGSLPDERGQLQTELKRVIKTKGISASATAGLGSVFVALADRQLHTHGRLSFVLPAAVASGEAWGQTRQLIASKYHLETVVVSHDADRPNFSENTDLSELLFIARKLEPKEKIGPTKYINLWRNPRSIYEAMDLANRIEQIANPVGIDESGITTIRGVNGKLGEIVLCPASKGPENWVGALFSQTELLRACWTLQKGKLRIPDASKAFSLPMVRLDSLGAIGPDRKRISEGFKTSTEDWSPYPGFWGHQSTNVRSIIQKPNSRLMVWLESPRGPLYGPHLWERSGNILLVERLRSNTHRVIGIGFDTNVLGNTWWALRTKNLTAEQQHALLLWLNSSLSMLLFFGRRVTTQGAWMQMKQPAWESMPVLDVRSLNSDQLKMLASTYDAVSNLELAPLAQLNEDPVRIRIDEAIAKVLDIPGFDPIRQLLAREPGLSAMEINPRDTDTDQEADLEAEQAQLL